MRSILLAIAAAVAVLSCVQTPAFAQAIPVGGKGQVPICTLVSLHAGTCQQSVGGYLATINNGGDTPGPNRCANGATPGETEVRCKYRTGVGWQEDEPSAVTGLANPLVSDLDAAGNDIQNPGAVDGRDVSVDGSKLDGIAAGATVGLGSDPAACPGGQFVTDQNQTGVLTCSTPAGGGDFLANGSVPMTGDLDVAGNDIASVSRFGEEEYRVSGYGTLAAAVTACQASTNGGTVLVDEPASIAFAAATSPGVTLTKCHLIGSRGAHQDSSPFVVGQSVITMTGFDTMTADGESKKKGIFVEGSYVRIENIGFITDDEDADTIAIAAGDGSPILRGLVMRNVVVSGSTPAGTGGAGVGTGIRLLGVINSTLDNVHSKQYAQAINLLGESTTITFKDVSTRKSNVGFYAQPGGATSAHPFYFYGFISEANVGQFLIASGTPYRFHFDTYYQEYESATGTTSTRYGFKNESTAAQLAFGNFHSAPNANYLDGPRDYWQSSTQATGFGPPSIENARFNHGVTIADVDRNQLVIDKLWTMRDTTGNGYDAFPGDGRVVSRQIFYDDDGCSAAMIATGQALWGARCYQANTDSVYVCKTPSGAGGTRGGICDHASEIGLSEENETIIRSANYLNGGTDWGQAIEDGVSAKSTRQRFTIALDGSTSVLGQSTAANLCPDPSATPPAAYELIGAGASWSNGHPTRLRPGSSMATGEFGTWTADFDVVANDATTNDSAGTSYDTITTPTDPRLTPYFLARGDIIYVSGFTNANNNTATTAEKTMPLATNELPFRIHRVEWNGSLGKIVVVPLLGKGTDAGLTTESDSDNETIRKASYQLKVCGRQVNVEKIQFDGNAGNADIGVWFYGDNNPNLACQATNDPYPTVCTGYGTGSMSTITSIGTGIRRFATSGHGLAGVMFQPAANSSAQMDLAYATEGESRDDFIGVLANALQAKPYMLIEQLNIQNYQQFGILHGSGGVNLSGNTVLSTHANCPATDSGCWAFYSSHNNRLGLDVAGNSFEVTGGNGVYVEEGSPNAARFYSITGNDFIANRSDSTGAEPVRLLVADMAGVAVIQPNRFYSNLSTVTVAPEVTIGNGSNATVPLELHAAATFGGGPSGVQPTGWNFTDGILNHSGTAHTTHATDCTSLTWGELGDSCFEQDADTLYICEPSSGVCDTAGEWRLVTGGGGGEANTISSPAGALALTHSTPKSGVNLQLVSLDAADFSIASDLVTIDDDSHAHTGSTISGVDVSSDTNLAVTAPVVLTGDTLSVSAASTTAAGIVELAIGSEVNAGTDATRAVTPDALDEWTGSPQLVEAGALVATSLELSDPGDNLRRYSNQVNSTSLGTPPASNCSFGFIGASVAAGVPYYHCNGGSLTAFGSGGGADLSANETITGNWVNTANPWADNEVSDTLTSSLFVGSGSSSTAVDLATAEVAGILGAANGGTGNGFTAFTGPATSTKTFTLPNASSTILTTNAAVTVAQGGSGAGTFTANGALYGNGTSAFAVTAAHTANGSLLIGDGSGVPTVATITGTANEITVTNGAGSITLDIPTNPTLGLANSTGLPISTGVAGLGTGVATALAVNVSSAGAFTTGSSTDTLTNKTLDTASNVLHSVEYIQVPADALVLPASNPAAAATWGTNHTKSVLSFADDADDFADFELLIPPIYRTSGGTLIVSFYWTTSSSSTNAARWCVQAADYAEDANADPTLDAAVCANEANTAADDLVITPVTLTASSFASGVANLRLSRDPDNGGDTLAGAVRLHSILIEIGVTE